MTTTPTIAPSYEHGASDRPLRVGAGLSGARLAEVGVRLVGQM